MNPYTPRIPAKEADFVSDVNKRLFHSILAMNLLVEITFVLGWLALLYGDRILHLHRIDTAFAWADFPLGIAGLVFTVSTIVFDWIGNWRVLRDMDKLTRIAASMLATVAAATVGASIAVLVSL